MTAVEEVLTDLANRMFVGPVWPASILVCLMVMYTLVALVGLIELDLGAPDIDLDADLDMDVDLGTPDLDAVDFDVAGGDAEVGHPVGLDFLGGFAATTVRWSNFGRVPLVIWFGAFTVLFWMVSYGLWHGFDASRYQPIWLPSVLLAARNFVIAVVATKFVTQPVVGKFSPEPGYDKDRLLGATCEISSIEASPSFGQAKFRTNAAPLLLNVRTTGAVIPKGTEVRITEFDPTKRIYTVTELEPENQS
ncbi:hypothetical protein Mal15_17360 [Stieleria maiorica]|uniref:Inner membrane protein YqiJ n=1 Tax=Stieleria maiorica TaxID=2795974 RepID=A0A5B9MDL4_9BACT|nr:OB-fold-containig protein [Stieleria maiorica]QEF97694.1 hypothetical protein Mal15_17360 [Stieleria maiorica]